jgi:cyclic di-GMP phosphodiesterase
MGSKKLPTMLVVENEPMIINVYQRIFRDLVTVVDAQDAASGLGLLAAGSFDLIVAEAAVAAPGQNIFIRSLEAQYPQLLPRLIITSGGLQLEAANDLEFRYGCMFVRKPAEPSTLLKAVKKVLTKTRSPKAFQFSWPAEAPRHTERPAVLVVDDDPLVTRLIQRQAAELDFEILTAAEPLAAISLLLKEKIDIVISDYKMPAISGVELLTLVRLNWPLAACIMITASNDIHLAEEVVKSNLVHFFISKPWKKDAFLRVLERASQTHQALETAVTTDNIPREIGQYASRAALSMAEAVDAKDRHTFHHSQKVAAYALEVGRNLRIGETALGSLCIGALLHDVGKIDILDEILLKPGNLTSLEFEIMKTHPEIGARIVKPIDFGAEVIAVVRQHHENYDGSGYPDGLAGDEISLAARITRVADAYEAMSTDRLYRKARSSEWIEKELRRCRGSQFDPLVVDAFLEGLGTGQIASSWKVRD